MASPKLQSDRCSTEQGLHVTVQVPEQDVQQIVDAVTEKHALKYGDYDSVTVRTSCGTQQFRSTGGGHNAATPTVEEVPCVELSFFLENEEATAVRVLKAIYWAHPYEEPIVIVEPCLRTLHIRGLDEDNPNRFWNHKTEDWVPQAHQPRN